jgi:hypothetical protein
MSTVAAPTRTTVRAAADGFEFALARLHARLAWRATEPAWQRLHAARSLPALLDAARGTTLAPYVAGVAATSTLLEIDLAFQTQLRSRIDEVASWLPAAWQPAARATATLIHLPAQLYRQHHSDGPAWLAALPAAASAATPTAPPRDPPRRKAMTPRGHPALVAWLRAWRRSWPSEAADLQAWADRLAADVTALAAGDLQQAPAQRAQLAARLASDLHARAAGQAIAPFAFLALLALDLQRLRGECVRARLAQESA